MSSEEEKNRRDDLLHSVKIEVKQLMELSATCKFIHEDNHFFTNFCGAIDNCFLYGLKTEFLNKPSSYDLVKKISYDCKSADEIVKIFNELDKNLNNNNNNKLNSEYSENSKSGIFSKLFWSSNSKSSISTETISHYVPLYFSNLAHIKALWIKIAIMRKCFNDIVSYIIKNASKYYHPYALMASSLESGILVSLIAGPCSFDKYTRLKTIENADPDADELIRRHKMHLVTPYRSPCLTAKSRLQSLGLSETNNSKKFNADNIREFVESLHQNVTSQLVYGKNHVIVNQKEKSYEGYLSLHLNTNGLILNWTPNEILNGSYSDYDETSKFKSQNLNDLIIYIELDTISFLHCHQENSKSFKVIFVSQNGAQHPPIQFTDSPSLAHFLKSVENALKTKYKFDPNDWQTAINMNRMPLIIKKISIFQESKSDSKPAHEAENRNEKIEIKNICDDIEFKILTRAFYGWLNYHRETKVVNKHLVRLLNLEPNEWEQNLSPSQVDVLMQKYLDNKQKIDENLWSQIIQSKSFNENLFYKIVYLHGIQNNDLRKLIWPYLLGICTFDMSLDEIEAKNKNAVKNYQNLIAEWKPYEEHSRLFGEKKLNSSQSSQCTPSDDSGFCSDVTSMSVISENSIIINNTPKKSSTIEAKRFFGKFRAKQTQTPLLAESVPSEASKRKFYDSRTDLYNLRRFEDKGIYFYKLKAKNFLSKIMKQSTSENLMDQSDQESPKSLSKSKILTKDEFFGELAQMLVSNAILKARHSMESEAGVRFTIELSKAKSIDLLSPIASEEEKNKSDMISIISPLSLSSSGSNHMMGDNYLNKELYDAFALNMHRIDKDVLRCDRNFWYFSSVENLNKLKNIIYTYVWETIEIGYIQGMCDIIAPLLVVFDNEAIVYEYFKKLMERMSLNFLSNSEMDKNFSNLRSLVQILDKELYEYLNSRGDQSQFYFTYRWFLLDFKRELLYKDIFVVWETILASRKYLKSDCFSLFFALALIEIYRDIILENQMDFTDIIKFFNEMSEKHDVKEAIELARELVKKLQGIIKEKYI
ncbi:small G signaling modulator 1 isoform X2 [Brachionus plicatilis]|uniref:Small G signaling modulator 1 isoform X2 n=1 Tax=Brachionus plicatilis TaxID=10195 RepID=A0A3M7R8K2_BRAPC|nr:small G signaling modulator 1 isoform X2 [Brachionus plicatilis]